MRKFIAIYELIGGITTLVLLLFGKTIITTQLYQPWTAEIANTIIISSVSLWLILSGVMLLKNNLSGYILSIILQFLQMIIIQTPNFYYQFYAPIGLGASFGIPGIHYIFGLGVGYDFHFLPQYIDAVYFGFNFISLFLFIVLLVLFRKRRAT